MSKLPYLNLGCGARYHKDWVNIDFISNSDNIIAHNLLKGIPFKDQTFEVVYHSHVLEHFTKADGKKFIQECYRVLKPNGIIRIAVPDLEQIAKEYLKNLNLAQQGDEDAQHKYEWILLEMYDQTVRNISGGEMALYLQQERIPCESYVYERIGEEGRQIRESYLNKKNQKENMPTYAITDNASLSLTHHLIDLLRPLKRWLKKFLFAYEIDYYERQKVYFEEQAIFVKIGKFRMSGEIHQWMYDRFSLKKLLEDVGFRNIQIKTAFDSNIPNWNSFELESKDNVVYKPDSLFVEAIK